MKQIYAEIKVKPLSVNQCWEGRRFKTRVYDDYIKECLYSLPKKSQIKAKRVAIEITLYLKNAERSDTDNFLKPILDIIVKKGWILDDRYVYKITAEKVKSKQEKISIKITEL